MTCIRIYRSICLAVTFIVLIAGKSAPALTPELIKNTTLVETTSLSKLPLWFKYGIPFGMVFSKTHIAENYTRYAPEGTATSTLLRELFNIKTGEFRIPDPQISVAGNYIDLKTMGKIIRLIFDSTQGGKKLLLDKLNDIKPEIKKTFKETLQKLDKNFSDSRFTSSFKKFTGSLIGSLDECNYWGNNKKPIYPQHTTLYALYSFIYKKALNRADLKIFFNGLCGESKNVWDEKDWEEESFDLKNLTKQKIELLVPSKLTSADIEKLLAMGIAQNWLTFNMPPMIEYASVTSKKYPIEPFSECFETMLRNMCNIFAFDPDTQLFSAKILLKNAPGSLKGLQQFYVTHPGKRLANQTIAPYTATDLQNKALGTAWLDGVIETNIPYATYVELYKQNGTRVKNAPLPDGPFAICLPDNSSLLTNKSPNKDGFYEHAIKIGYVKYDAFTPSSGLFGFALAPYTHTLIFVLDHILGLKLFEGVNIEEELVKPNFEETYMEKLSHIPPFKKIMSDTGGRFESHTITTKQNQAFIVNIAKGRHGFVKTLYTSTSKDDTSEKLTEDTPTEIRLFISHALNINPKLSGILGQSYLFRGDWFLNEAKFNAIDKIIDHLGLKKEASNYDDEEYLKDIFIYSEDDVPDDMEFYLQVIKNILEKFTVVVGEVDLCDNIINHFKQFFLHNKPFKKIIVNDVHNKLLQQTMSNQDNILMVAVKSGNPKEVDRVLNFIADLKDKDLNKKLLEQTNKNKENITMVALKFGNKQMAEKIKDVLED